MMFFLLNKVCELRILRFPVHLSLALLFLSSPLFAQAKVDVARSEWMKGYVKLETADKAVLDANKLAALQLYREAVAVFQEVRRKYPQWNPSLLNYRLNYCQQKITQLEEDLQGEATTMDRDKLLDLTARQAKLLHENTEQIRELNTTIGILNEAIKRARSEAATVSASESNVQTLQEARSKLEDQCRLLELKFGKAQEEMDGLRKKLTDKDTANALRSELKQATTQLKELHNQLSDSQKQLQMTGEELNRSHAETARLKKDNKEQVDRLTAVTERVKELTDAANDLNGRLKATQLRVEQQDVEIRLHKESLQRFDREKQETQTEVANLRDFRDKYILAQDSNQKLNARIGELENHRRERDEVIQFGEQKNVALAAIAIKLENEKKQLQQTLADVQLELVEKGKLCETIEQDRRRFLQEQQQVFAQERQTWQKQEQELQQLLGRERQTWQKREQELQQQVLTLQGNVTATAQQVVAAQERLAAQDAAAVPSGQPVNGEPLKDAVTVAELTLLRQERAGWQARELAFQQQIEPLRQTAAEGARLTTSLERERQERGVQVALVERLQIEKKAQAALVERLQNEKIEQAAAMQRLQQSLEEQRGKVVGLNDNVARLEERIRGLTAELQQNGAAAERDAQAGRQALADNQQANQRLMSQLQQLQEGQKEFVALSQLLKERESTLTARNSEIQRQAESLAAANALVLARQDAAQSAQAELQALKRKFTVLETQNNQQKEQLQAAQWRNGDFEKSSGEVRGLLAGSQQREQELLAAVHDLKLQLEARTQLAVKLEKAVADLERVNAEAAEQVKKENASRAQLAEELNRARNKSEAVDGITSNYLELQASLETSARDLQALRQQAQTAETEISTLRTQLERRAQQVSQLSEKSVANDSKVEQLWMARLTELNTKLENEENRRKALELALIQRESAQPVVPAQPIASVQATSPDAQVLGKYLREQEVILNGFLRQGVEAEKNKKIEAARWNYGRALELQPNNLLALKRLGLLAAGSGDDQGAVQYLKQAFRQDPDDQEILLALGFAMVSLGQSEWALANLGRALALNPDNATVSRLFGVALVNLGWTQAAERQFVRTLALAPKDPETAFNLAVLCLTDQPPRIPDAKKWYDQAVRYGAERDPRLEEAFK